MKLQINPNAWSCLPTAAAMILDLWKWEVIRKIGHNGSKIMYPNFKDPHGRRGFHIQEIIDVAQQRGFSVTPIEALPCSKDILGHIFKIDFKISNEQRFKNYLTGTIGIITGVVNGVGHAVAWNGECYDPRGRICVLDDLRMDIDCYWLFQEIKSI